MATMMLSAIGTSMFGPIGGAIGAFLGRGIDGRIETALSPKVRARSILDQLKVQSVEEGAPMARIWGQMKISGHVIWADRFIQHATTERLGGKGGQRVENLRYSLSFAIGLCEGPISGIGRVWANNILLNKAQYNYRLYLGDEAQLPDPLIEAAFGLEEAPAYRGLAYIVFEAFDLSDFGDHLPFFSFEIFGQQYGPAASDGTNSLIKNMVFGTGLGGFVLDPVPAFGETLDEAGPPKIQSLNQHANDVLADIEVTLSQLAQDFPNVRHLTMPIMWFANLDNGFSVAPRVDESLLLTAPNIWQVSGLNAQDCEILSGDGAHGGGSYDDGALVRFLGLAKALGFSLTIAPKFAVDGAATLGANIAANDNPAAVEAALDGIFGAAVAQDFHLANGAILASITDFGLSGFYLHYAKIAQISGGIFRLVLGAGLGGLMAHPNPLVVAGAIVRLKNLAAMIKSILPDVRVSVSVEAETIASLSALWADPLVDEIAVSWVENIDLPALIGQADTQQKPLFLSSIYANGADEEGNIDPKGQEERLANILRQLPHQLTNGPHNFSILHYDMRPAPFFPFYQNIWPDGLQALLGPNLAGRPTSQSLANIISALAAEVGLDAQTGGVLGDIAGFAFAGPNRLADILGPLFEGLGIAATLGTSIGPPKNNAPALPQWHVYREGVIGPVVQLGLGDFLAPNDGPIKEVRRANQGAVFESIVSGHNHDADGEPISIAARLTYENPPKGQQAQSVHIATNILGSARLFSAMAQYNLAKAQIDQDWMVCFLAPHANLRLNVGQYVRLPDFEGADGADDGVWVIAQKDGTFDGQMRLMRASKPGIVPTIDGVMRVPPLARPILSPEVAILDVPPRFLPQNMAGPMPLVGAYPKGLLGASFTDLPDMDIVRLRPSNGILGPNQRGQNADLFTPALVGYLVQPLEEQTIGRILAAPVLLRVHQNWPSDRITHVSKMMARVENGGYFIAENNGTILDIIGFQSAIVRQNTPVPQGGVLLELVGVNRGLSGQITPPILPQNSPLILLDSALVPLPIAPSMLGVSHDWEIVRRKDGRPLAGKSINYQPQFDRPFAPVHLSAIRENDGVGFSWIRRGNGEDDGWGLLDVAPGWAQLGWDFCFLAQPNSTAILRQYSAEACQFFYASENEMADFGGPQDGFTVKIAQKMADGRHGDWLKTTISVAKTQ